MAIIPFVKELVQRIVSHDTQGLASEMAYNLILSLIPALIFLVSIVGLLGGETEFRTLTFNTIDAFAPPHTVLLLKQTLVAVFEGSSRSLTLISLLIALWSASNSAKSLIKGLLRAYERSSEGQSFWQRGLLSMAVIVSLSIVLFVISNLILFGDLLLRGLDRILALPLSQVELLNGVRWLTVIVSVIFFSAFIYAIVPSPKKIKNHWQGALVGAVVFFVMWATISGLFSFYINNFGRFNPVYGSLGAVVILLTWLYLSSFCLLVGGEVAAMRYKFH